jgi:DNA-directed RNA polymerase subunit M/transcription elongation factor TFIIS
MAIVILNQNGNMEDLELKNSPSAQILTVLKSKVSGTTKPGYIGNVSYPDSEEDFLHFFGLSSGSSINESKHQLPYPLDDVTIYGNAFVVKSKSSKQPVLIDDLVILTSEEYEAKYELLMCDETSSESEVDELEEEEEEIEEEEPEVAPKQTKKKGSKVIKQVVPLKGDEEPNHPAQKQFIQILDKITELDKSNISKIENSVFTKTIELIRDNWGIPSWDNPTFVGLYVDTARHIFLNLSPKSYVGNKSLISRINSGDINPIKIAFLKPEEMSPERWKRITESVNNKEMELYNKANMAGVIHYCRVCKKKSKCSFYQLQTRSADEPMTNFWSCLECNSNWCN